MSHPASARRGNRKRMLQTEIFIKQANIDLAIKTSVCMARTEGLTVKLAIRGKFIANANAENSKSAIISLIDPACSLFRHATDAQARKVRIAKV